METSLRLKGSNERHDGAARRSAQQRIIARNGIVKSTKTTSTLLGRWLFYVISDLLASMYMASLVPRLPSFFRWLRESKRSRLKKLEAWGRG